ncbi:ThiF family adenylyltransferase [Kitasatospora sp. NPDC056651]|uniref:ThiF family adenylyltransferase n=1 Tax=Kitasatospora sp. NPDC056651 TaxID=3345892 RepID=UPI0036A7C6C1
MTDRDPAAGSAELYSRQRAVPGWDQERLAAARCVVVGMGALGSEVSRLLASVGVGRLLLCDPDSVEESNLSRGVLFRAADLGRPKAEVAAAALAELAPGVATTARRAPLLSGVGLAELRAADLVVSCLDSRAARIQLASRVNLVAAPMLDGGTHPWGGEVRHFRPGGPCFGCGSTPRELAVRDDPWSCTAPSPGPARVEAASAPVSALVGAQLGLWAVRLLLGLPVPEGAMRLDPLSGTALVTTVGGRGDPSPACPLHERVPDGLVRAVPLTVDDPVSALLDLVGPAEQPMSWAGFSAPGSRSPVPATTRLRAADPGASLGSLGIPPGELIPVLDDRGRTLSRYLELRPGTGWGGVAQ